MIGWCAHHMFTRCCWHHCNSTIVLAGTQTEFLYAALDFGKSLLEIKRLEETSICFDHLLRISLMEERTIVHLTIVNCLYLSLKEPFNAFAIFPQSILHLVVFGNYVSAQAMLLSFKPVALIASLISPRVNSKTMFLVVFVLTLVHTAIVPYVDSHAFHIVVEPFALVFAPIKP